MPLPKYIELVNTGHSAVVIRDSELSNGELTIPPNESYHVPRSVWRRRWRRFRDVLKEPHELHAEAGRGETLDDLKMPQLREIAKGLGFTVKVGTMKADVIDAIKAARGD